MTTTTIDSLLTQVTGMWINLKNQKCADGPDDLAMQLDVRYPDDSVALAVIPEREYIAVAVKNLRAQTGQRERFIAVLADAYVRSWDVKNEDVPNPDEARYANSEAFKAGDMRVTDALMILVFDAQSGETRHRLIRYTYRDNGKPKFDKPDDEMTEMEGGILDELRRAVS